MRSLRVVLCGFTAAMACAGTAAAGTISLPNESSGNHRTWLAEFRAAPGETNRLTIRGCYFGGCSSPGEMNFSDAMAPLSGPPLVASAGCTLLGDDPRGLLCRPVEYVDAYLGN